MPPGGLGKAKRFASQALNPGAPSQMLAFNGLGLGFTNGMKRGCKMPFIGSPTVSLKLVEAKRHSQTFEFEAGCIFVL